MTRLLRKKPFACYDVWGVEQAKGTMVFSCAKEYVVAVVGKESLHDYVYYKQYDGENFYKLSPEELEWMHFSGEEIPF